MKFYIVTPAYNSLVWLQSCIRSVADQVTDGVEVHHHIQDGGSKDGTSDWLREWQEQHQTTPGYTFTFTSARDSGMYDALNKAWDAMPDSADVAAHLNSDEQYTPGALSAVATAFGSRPAADALVATYLVLDEKLRYICHRRSVKPSYRNSRVLCEIITCACFMRAGFFRKSGVRFDTNYKSMADHIFYRDFMACHPTVQTIPNQVTSIYVVTGNNISWQEITHKERREIHSQLPFYLEKCEWLMVKWHNLKRVLVDRFCEPPAGYALYHRGEMRRAEHRIPHPACLWKFQSEGDPESDRLS